MNQQQTKQLEEKVPTKDEDCTPRILGRYRILDEVGQGATAIVYRAYDPQLDRFLAIKVLRERLAQDHDYRDAFIREARLAAQLTHSNIVTIFDVGISQNKPYIAMELLEGHTLEEILRAKHKLNLTSSLNISIQLASALSYAHQRGVVHRDIKPGNIIILKDRKSVKLMDFGIAQIDDRLAESGKLNDKVLGTPEYMSPEQILGKTLDSRSDIYSSGVLLYRMLTGLPPFIAEDLGDLFKQIIKAKQPELVIDNPLVKDELKDLLRKLLQKSPQKRFQSANQLVNELKQIYEKLNKKKKTKEAFYRSLTTRWTIIMAGSVFVSMCVGLFVVYFMQNRALSGVTYEYGNTVGKMIAYQSSEAIVLGDLVGLNALVKENASNEQLEVIYVLDNNGKILASSSDKDVGELFNSPNVGQPVREIEDTKIYQRQSGADKSLYDILLPINFGERRVGQLFLSYSANRMVQASNTTLITMLVVMLLTLLVVSIATLILAKQTSQDYKRVALGLKKMALGRVDARIISERNDEASYLFAAFNQLAAYLERLSDKRSEKSQSDTQRFDLLNVKEKQKGQKEQEDIDTVELVVETQECEQDENK